MKTYRSIITPFERVDGLGIAMELTIVAGAIGLIAFLGAIALGFVPV